MKFYIQRVNETKLVHSGCTRVVHNCECNIYNCPKYVTTNYSFDDKAGCILISLVKAAAIGVQTPGCNSDTPNLFWSWSTASVSFNSGYGVSGASDKSALVYFRTLLSCSQASHTDLWSSVSEHTSSNKKLKAL